MVGKEVPTSNMGAFVRKWRSKRSVRQPELPIHTRPTSDRWPESWSATRKASVCSRRMAEIIEHEAAGR